MALGRKVIDWDARTMIRGVSTSERLPDGAFSSETDQVQLTYVPGVTYIPESPTDISTNVAGEMIASCEDPTASYTRLWVGRQGSDDGQFYSQDGTGAITTRGALDNTQNYIFGRTDFIGFANEAYATTATTIVRWSSIGAANTFNFTFFGFSDAGAPHPALVYEGNAYFGDGDELLRMSTAGGTPTVILTLTSGSVITSLGIDPGSGRMLIGIVGQYNLSDTANSQARIGFYDGFSNKLLRVVVMDDMVTAFPHTEGQLYVAYGKNLGYWNGSGATFLKRLGARTSNSELFYKHHFTSIGPTLYFAQRGSNSSFPGQIMAHGPIEQGGSKVFYPVLTNYVNANIINAIAYVGTLDNTTTGQFLSYGFSSAKFYKFNVNGVTAGGVMSLISNVYPLDNENDGMWIRRVIVIWNEQVSNNVDPGSIRFYDQDGAIAAGSSGIFDLRNTSGAASAIKEIPLGGGTGLRVRELRWQLILDTVNPGIKRIIVYGDPANTP